MVSRLADRYRLLDRLGAGGMSVVWRAHDEVLDREVAVKVLSSGPAADPDLLDRIRIEARSAARLRHPNVVAVYDYGETADALPYVVMELVDGRSLADVLAPGALPWKSAAAICAQVAAALAAAHARGIVHRDVKPSNVMVTSDGVKLVDFGISATIGEADGVDGELFGTPAYLAPERLSGGTVRPATDVYALGLLLYLTLAGRMPWEASTTTEMLRAHAYAEPARLPAVPGLPRAVAKLCRHSMSKHPDDRPSAETAARVLAEAAGLPAAAPLLTDPNQATVAIRLAGLTADSPATDTAPDRPGRRLPTRLVPARLLAGGLMPDRLRSGPLLPSGLRSSPLLSTRRRRSLTAAAATSAVALTAGGALWFGGHSDPPAPAAAAGTPASDTASAVPSTPAPPTACEVGYTIRSATNGRISTRVTIANTGPVPAADWRLSFALPDGQKLVRGWGPGWRQEGQSLHVGGDDLAAGGRVATGFDASYHDATTLPAQFRLNGTVCTAQMSVAGMRTAAPPAPRVARTKVVRPAAPKPGAPAAPKPAAPAAPKPAANSVRTGGGNVTSGRVGIGPGKEGKGNVGKGNVGKGHGGNGGDEDEDDEDEGEGDDGEE